MFFQAVRRNSKSLCTARKTGPKGARLLNTDTSSAPSHLTWEIPKGELL